MKNTYFIVC